MHAFRVFPINKCDILLQPQQNGNSNSNSANGGSVNSQDSLWNVKSQPQQQQFNNAYGGGNQYNPNPQYGYDQYQQQQQQVPQQQYQVQYFG